MKNILVIGATGPQGYPVAEKLIEAGFNVRALVRNPAKAENLAAKGVEIIKGDLEDAASVTNAMNGQDGVFMLISFFTGTHAQAKTVIDAAATANVSRIVWNVAGRILPFDTGNPAVDKWRPILADLELSGIPFTALQPTVYMENFLIPAIAQEVAENNVLAYPMPEAVRCQWISHQDAAAYVVAAFKVDNRDNLLIEVGGPEKLSGAQIAERFSNVLGREITFRPMPPEEFAQIIAYGGNEEAVVSHYRNIFANPEIMTTNVDFRKTLEVLPIIPMTFEDFTRLYKVFFSPPGSKSSLSGK